MHIDNPHGDQPKSRPDLAMTIVPQAPVATTPRVSLAPGGAEGNAAPELDGASRKGPSKKDAKGKGQRQPKGDGQKSTRKEPAVPLPSLSPAEYPSLRKVAPAPAKAEAKAGWPGPPRVQATPEGGAVAPAPAAKPARPAAPATAERVVKARSPKQSGGKGRGPSGSSAPVTDGKRVRCAPRPGWRPTASVAIPTAWH